MTHRRPRGVLGLAFALLAGVGAYLAATQGASTRDGSSGQGQVSISGSSSFTTTAPDRQLDAELTVETAECGTGECLIVDAGERRVSELFIVTRAPKSGDTVVVIDPGGPGFDPAVGLSIELLPSWLRALPVVAIREPWSWTTDPVGPACWESMERHVDAVRSRASGATLPVPTPVGSCDAVAMHGSPGRVIASARAVEHLGASSVIIVGYSFGAVRVGADAQLDDWKADWEVLLVDPAPHVGTVSASSLIEGRVNSALSALGSVRDGCSNYCSEDIAKIERALPVNSQERSVEITIADLHLGVVASALRGPDGIEEIASSLGKAAGDLSPQHLLPIAVAADDASGRFGIRSHAAPALANVVGLCIAYPGWADVDEASWSGPAETLAALYSVCTRFDGVGNVETRSPIPNSCVVINPDDPAVADEHVAGWRRVTGRVVEISSAAHGGAFNSNRDLREECRTP